MSARVTAPLARHWMRLWRNGQTDADGVAEALSVSRRRAYQLRTDYLAACAAGQEEAWRPGLSGGDHRGDWPEEIVALAAKLHRAKPPANYALIASKIFRRHGWKIHRAGIRGRAKPKGVMGCEIWVKVGDAPPNDCNDCTFLSLDTASPYLAEYPGSKKNQIAHYMARWVNTRGAKGPWSETVSATIGA